MKRALGLIFLASLLWPILENTGVSLMARHHPLDVVFLRYSAHLLLLLPLVLLRSGPSALATRRPVAQLGRGVAMAGMPMCWLLASAFDSNAWIWTIFWTMPGMAMVGAALLLRDRPRVAAWIAIAAGIGGTALIRETYIGGGSLVGTLIAFGMAGTFAAYIVLSRILREERLEASLFYTAVGAIIPTAALVWRVWTPLTPGEVVPALAVGAFSIAILAAIDLSLEAAAVSVVAPMLGLVSIWESLIAVPLHGAELYTTQQVGMLAIAAGVGFWLWRHPAFRRSPDAPALAPATGISSNGSTTTGRSGVSAPDEFPARSD